MQPVTETLKSAHPAILAPRQIHIAGVSQDRNAHAPTASVLPSPQTQTVVRVAAPAWGYLSRMMCSEGDCNYPVTVSVNRAPSQPCPENQTHPTLPRAGRGRGRRTGYVLRRSVSSESSMWSRSSSPYAATWLSAELPEECRLSHLPKLSVTVTSVAPVSV